MLDDDELLAGFIEEVNEHLATTESDLLALEVNPTDIDIINRIFRSVHSIKGGAGFFGLNKMNNLAHAMETLMAKVRTSLIVITKEHTDILLQGLDFLNLMAKDTSRLDELDIARELKILESMAAVENTAEPVSAVVQPADIEPVENKAVNGAQSQPQKFNISPSEIEDAVKDGMNVFTISAFLNRDIMEKGKTPYQFIKELEELGRFLDSYLDVENAVDLDKGLDNDLAFVFIFATIMDAEIAAQALSIDSDQIREFALEEFESTQATSPDNPASEQIEEAPLLKNGVSETSGRDVKSEQKSRSDRKPETPGVEKTPSKVLPAVVPSTADDKAKTIKQVKAEENIRVGVGKLNKLVNLAGELVLVRNQLLQTGVDEGNKIPGFMGILQNLNMVTSELQEEILNTRMQPVSTVFGKFPRLIRELGASLGKDIGLVTEGNEVELDKTVLEALSDPLTHIVRNTADHGIETADARRKAGKPPQGKLLLKAYHESGQVIIMVRDDGKGIDADRIAEKAHEKGLISDEDLDNLGHQENINLIFLPGFSTAENISSVSGRGVGMDVVRSNIEAIGGSVELSSMLGEGTTIKMTLPLTMAIVSCLIVESENERFAIPQINLEELVMIKSGECASMMGYVQERYVLKIRGELLPLVTLAEGLNIPGRNGKRRISSIARSQSVDIGEGSGSACDLHKLEEEKEVFEADTTRVLIVSIGINKIGIIVDSILGTEEIVVKPMPEYLQQVTTFSGATILGDGTVAMILDIPGFVQKNQLFNLEKRTGSFIPELERRTNAEMQSLLIFDNGTEEQFALTIPLIQRVDTITLDQIQHVGKKEYIEYRRQQVRLLRIEDYLSVQRPSYDSEHYNIIVPKEVRIPVAILIHQVLDTKVMEIELTKGSINEKGIHGSTLIDGRITLLLDLFALLEMGEPDSVYRVEIDKQRFKDSKVLLVEDTPMFMAIMHAYLVSMGLNVTTAVNGKLAFERMKNETFDMVLSDIEMPEMDGWELIKTIRGNEQWKKIPVIAVTSLDDELTVKKGLDAGFTEWILKLNKERVFDCVDRYL